MPFDNLPVAPGTLAAFVLAVLVLLASPGPNMAMVVVHGATLGWRGGLAAAAGIAFADLLMTGLVAAGLGAAIVSWPPSLVVIQFAGALFLLRLAWQAWTRPSTFTAPARTLATVSEVVARALLNSLLNPKALIFFMVFLPAFAKPERGDIALQLAVLGVTLSIVAAVFHALLGLAGAAVVRRFIASASHAHFASRLMAVLFVALALRLLTMELH